MSLSADARHRRTVRLVLGVGLGGVVTLFSHLALPTGGHNVLLGMVCLLGMTLGPLLAVVCAAWLLVHVFTARRRE